MNRSTQATVHAEIKTCAQIYIKTCTHACITYTVAYVKIVGPLKMLKMAPSLTSTDTNTLDKA